MKKLLLFGLLLSGACKGDVAPDPVYDGPLVTMEDVDDRFAEQVAAGPSRVRVPYKKEDAIRGAAVPLVTIVEFSDFQCPFCGQFANTLHELERTYPDDVRIVFKQFPLPMHPDAPLAAMAAIAAQQQGKFWAMHDTMFKHRTALKREGLLEHAKDVGLDVEAFEAALDDPATKHRLDLETMLGRQLGVRGTPSFFINGRFHSGAMDPAALGQLVEEERAFAKGLIDAGAKREEVYAHLMRAAPPPGAPDTRNDHAPAGLGAEPDPAAGG
jgi:protein-disulfide isomerase